MANQPPPPHFYPNSHLNCERAIKTQINLEMKASCVYQSMSCYFDRDDVAMRHLAQFFMRLSSEERAHAEKLIHLLNQRGVQVTLPNIQDCKEWDNGLNAMDYALRLEKHVCQNLANLRQLAVSTNDAQLCELLQTHSLHDQTRSTQGSGDHHHTNPSHVRTQEDELAEFFFQKLNMHD